MKGKRGRKGEWRTGAMEVQCSASRAGGEEEEKEDDDDGWTGGMRGSKMAEENGDGQGKRENGSVDLNSSRSSWISRAPPPDQETTTTTGASASTSTSTTSQQIAKWHQHSALGGGGGYAL